MTGTVDTRAFSTDQVTRRPSLVLVLACSAQFLGLLDVTIVNVALPSMRESLALSPGGLQWVVNGYTLTFAGFLLLGGRAADLVGLKRVFLGGLALFTVASLAGGLAQEGWQLVAARAAQGVGGALLTPATLSMITLAYPEGRERARALGIWAGVSGAGAALGGVIGGVLTGLLSWRWVLIVNVPLGVALLALGAWALVHTPRQGRGGRLDLPGSVTVTLGTGCLVGAIIGLEQWGWDSLNTAALFCAAVVLLVAFVLIERSAEEPLVPLSIFRVRSVSVANALSLVNSGVVPATFFFLSLHLQQVLELSPLAAGLAMVPAAVGMALGSVAASWLVGVIGSRVLLLGGSAVAAWSTAWLARLDADGSYLAQIPVPLLLAMIGLGLTGLPLTLAAVAGVGPEQQGLAAGLLNTSRQVGGAVGLAALVALASARTSQLMAAGEGSHTALTGGFQVALLVGAAMTLATGVASLALPPTKRHEPVPPPEAVHG